MILDDLKNSTLERVRRSGEIVTLDEIRERIVDMTMRRRFAFEEALKGSGMHYICEVKKASPSKGIIAGDFRIFR